MIAAHDASTLRATLARDGYATFALEGAAREAATSPWAFAERILGAAPRMVERQPIRPVAQGRSFASTDVFTPLHTDSQLFLGAPPDVQVMACAQPAEDGGESLLLDAWSLLDAIAREDPGLFADLFGVHRRIPFVFGDVFGPTAALRGGSLAVTHSPMPTPADPVGRRLGAWLARARPAVVPVARGAVLVADNRRMLHGRNAFRDPRREFVRLLVWLPRPVGERADLSERARRAAAASEHTLRDAPPEVRARYGLGAHPGTNSDINSDERLRVVRAMLDGTPPGVLQARLGVPEPVLYQWRDAALGAALRALADAPAEDLAARCAPWLPR